MVKQRVSRRAVNRAMAVFSQHQVSKPVVRKEKAVAAARRSLQHPKEHAEGVPVEPSWYDCDEKTDIQTPCGQSRAGSVSCQATALVLWLLWPGSQHHMEVPKLFLRNRFTWVNPNPLPSLPGAGLVSHPLRVGNSQGNKGVSCDLNVWRIFGLCYLLLVITDVWVGS